MRRPRLLAFVVALVALVSMPRLAEARSPRNPYSSFNLSGINYGAQQWDRAQREGRRAWPSSDTPSRGYVGGGVVTSGAGGFVQGPRTVRRWRR